MNRRVAISAVIAGLIFAVDLSLPLGVAGGVPYVALVLTGLWFPGKRAILVLGLVGSILTLAGYVLSEPGGIPWMVFTNRALALAAIWVTVILCFQRKEREQEESEGKSNARLRGAVDTLQEAFAYFDTADRLVMCNDEFRRLHPASNNMLQPGNRFEDIVRSVVEAGQVANVFGHEEEFIRKRIERHRNPQGPFLRELTNGTWYIINEGRTPDGGIYQTMTDVTELKAAETKLRESESLFRAIVDNSPTKIHIKDVEGRYTLINPQAEKLFGVTDAEGRGKTSHDLFPEQAASAFVDHDRAVIESGRTIEQEEEWELEGGVHTFLTVKFPIYNLDGVSAVGAIGTDITERKEIEQSLRTSEEHLRRSVVEAPIPIIMHAEDGEVLMISKKWTELSGYSHSDIPTISDWTEKAYGYDKQRMERQRGVINALYDLERPSEHEALITTASGEQRLWEVRDAPLGRLSDGRRFVISMAVDITERRTAEDELRESEARLSNILDNSPSPIYFKDTEAKFIVANKRYEEMYNVRFPDIRNRTSLDIFPGELGKMFFQHDQDVLSSRKIIEREENIFGRTYLTLKFPIVGPDDGLLGLGGIEVDITALKGAEEKLRRAHDELETRIAERTRELSQEVDERTRAEQILSDALESIADGVILYDSDDRIVLCNSNYRKSLVAVADLLVPGTRFEDLIRATAEHGLAKGAKEDVEAYVRQRLRKHRELKGPFELETGDGHWFLISEYKTQDGGTFIVRNDITERKRAVEALQKSEDRYARAISGTNDGLWDWNIETGENYFSPRFERILGYDESELEPVLQTFLDLLHPDDRKRTSEAIPAHFKDRVPYDLEYRLRCKDGEYKWLHARGQATWNEHGEATTMAGSISDISERKRAEQAVRESEERTRKILENLADGAITIDADGLIEYVNPETERIFGYSTDELIGRNVSLLMPEPDRNNHDGHISNYLKTGKARIIGIGREVTGLRKDGTTFPMELTVSATITEGRTVFTGTLRDMTERKKAEQALIEAKLGAETASRMKTDFLANMSHELRTPLNAIIGFSDTMKEKVFGPLANDKYEEYINDIHDSGTHLLELINDILDVSMIEAGQLDLNEEWINVAKVIDASIRLVKHRAEKGNVRLTLNVSDSLPGLFADERRIKQILLNLLSNAVKFTPEGGEVTLDARRAPDEPMVFIITDTGIGMAEDKIAKAMEPFGQIDSSLSRKYEGTGLGLPVTRSLVEAHGGSIEIKSKPKLGTTVTVRFPADRVIVEPVAGEGRLAGTPAERKLH